MKKNDNVRSLWGGLSVGASHLGYQIEELNSLNINTTGLKNNKPAAQLSRASKTGVDIVFD